MKSLWRFMGTFHLLFAQLPNGFSILVMAERALNMKHVLGGHERLWPTVLWREPEALIVEDPTITLRFLATEVHMLSSMSSLVGPRGAQDGSLTSWQQNKKNKGWQSAAIGCKNLNQMFLRGFQMLLRVTSVGFPSSVWKINVLTWCGWPKMNQARRCWKQVSVQEREWSPFSSILRGLLLST